MCSNNQTTVEFNTLTNTILLIEKFKKYTPIANKLTTKIKVEENVIKIKFVCPKDAYLSITKLLRSNSFPRYNLFRGITFLLTKIPTRLLTNKKTTKPIEKKYHTFSSEDKVVVYRSSAVWVFNSRNIDKINDLIFALMSNVGFTSSKDPLGIKKLLKQFSNKDIIECLRNNPELEISREKIQTLVCKPFSSILFLK